MTAHDLSSASRDDFLAAVALAAGVTLRDGVMIDAAVERVERGWLDKRIILQDRTWITENGEQLPLEAMSVAHRRNVIEFLSGFEDTWAAMALLYVTGEVLLGHIDLEEGARQHGLVAQLASGWMQRTPLVQRLLDLNGQADA
jgi:hypothetical protein